MRDHDMRQSTIGIILAGGQARRMGGGDKSFLHVGGSPMLARVIDRLRPQCASLILSANGDEKRFSAFGLPVITDDVTGSAGPLAGILASLNAIAARHPDIGWAVSVAADTPFLPADFVARLHGAREAAGARLACARSGGRLHPVDALWPVALRHYLRDALVRRSIRKVEEFGALHARACADWPSEPYDPFFNVNTPEDLARAEQICTALAAASHS